MSYKLYLFQLLPFTGFTTTHPSTNITTTTSAPNAHGKILFGIYNNSVRY